MTDSNSNRHPCYDVIMEWAEDERKTLQYQMGDKWIDYQYDEADPQMFSCRFKWRIKPREFEQYAYYPAIRHNGKEIVVMYRDIADRRFVCNVGPGYWFSESDLKWIGEKLEIEWPHED